MKVDKLSPSEINTFKRCPRRWYYREVEKPTIKTDEKYLDFGATVHEAIHIYFSRVSNTPTDKDIHDIFYKALEDNYHEVFKRLTYRYGKCRKHFVKFERKRKKEWDTYLPTFTERRIRTDRIVGVIDFYSQDERTIIDWKTGNYKEDNSVIRQGSIYKLLAEEEGYPVDTVKFVFLKDGQVFDMPETEDGWVKNEIREMLDMVDNERFPLTDNKYDCRYCAYNLVCKLSNKEFWGEWW